MEIDWWPSPAKLNLFLHVTGRLESGYHSLQTVFQLLDRGDRLAFDIIEEGKIQLFDTIPGVDNEQNLVVRAARLLKSEMQVKQGCAIHLDKVLPMGGGVGGGSSNAATTLVALNHLWKCGLSKEQLIEMGGQLGADVPVFIHGQSCFAQGTGDQFTPIKLPLKWYLVVYPGIHMSTEELFNHPDLDRSCQPILIPDYTFESTKNIFEPLVTEQNSKVANLLQWLLQFAPSRMTGTGACVFAMFDSEKEAKQVHHKLPPEWHGFVASGVPTSPLLQKIQTSSVDHD